ncbi:MAG: polyprenyl synthetase family protein [Gemmatimonadota bacterium]
MNEATEVTLAQWRARIDGALARVTANGAPLPEKVRDAVHYSLTGEGKRLRGLLVLAAYEALGGKGNAVGLAAAVEIVHAYSLVHDDLPCMDNDHIRRGRPTTHRAFGVATATVAGVAMVALAVTQAVQAAETLGLSADVTKRLVSVLMQSSGATGMVGGQLMDLMSEGREIPVKQLEAIHRAKTGALIAASVTLGGLAAGGSAAAVDALAKAGESLGLAFQIADDVLDATASSEALGKSAGADAKLEKSTYVSTMGVQAAKAHGEALVADAMQRLQAAGLKNGPLLELARFVAARRS